MPRKILFDTDPGVDDAMALLFALASPELELLGITTVFGNHHVEQTTRNALHVLEVAGRTDLPVVAGAAEPLRRPYRGKRSSVHGEDGLGGAAQPPAALLARDVPGGAASFITQSVMDQPGELTLLAVGPLTNLALALEREPGLPQAVQQVIIMGGAAFCPGNASPVAEANIFNDPEAADRVLRAGWPVTMVGLDVTLRTVMSEQYIRDLAAGGRSAARFIGEITPVYFQAYRERYGLTGIPTHDPSAVAFAVEPALFTVERHPVHVETEGRCAGQTVVDRRRQWEGLPEVDVCVAVDSERLLALFHTRLGS